MQDSKQAVAEDYLPDGTHVPAGAVLVYRMYTMGRLERSVVVARGMTRVYGAVCGPMQASLIQSVG